MGNAASAVVTLELSDATLPPGFSVPAPTDEVDGEDIDEVGEETEFVKDFHEDAEETAD